MHTAAPHYLPPFITPPGQTDYFLLGMAVFLAAAVLGFGVLFFHLHTLPERIAHKSHKLQFEIVAVLGLISLFTHMHIFWIIGLVLALIDIPDLGGWLGRIAGSVEKIATRSGGSSGHAVTAAETGAGHDDTKLAHDERADQWPAEVSTHARPYNSPDAKRS